MTQRDKCYNWWILRVFSVRKSRYLSGAVGTVIKGSAAEADLKNDPEGWEVVARKEKQACSLSSLGRPNKVLAGKVGDPGKVHDWPGCHGASCWGQRYDRDRAIPAHWHLEDQNRLAVQQRLKGSQRGRRATRQLSLCCKSRREDGS